MPKKPPKPTALQEPLQVALGWKALNAFPPGALALVPAVEPSRRDAFLATIVAYGNPGRCLWIAATEGSDSIKARLKRFRGTAMLPQMTDLAEAEFAEIPHVDHPGFARLASTPAEEQSLEQERRAYREFTKACEARSEKVKALAQKLVHAEASKWISCISDSITFAQVPGGGAGGLGIMVKASAPDVLIVDDASSISVDGKKTASSKQTAEVVRILKRIALEQGARVIVGMPAPRRIAKDRFSGREDECDVELSDLAPYGNPHESADAVIEATSDVNCRVIFNRYRATSD